VAGLTFNQQDSLLFPPNLRTPPGLRILKSLTSSVLDEEKNRGSINWASS
jgi:hypothetical protein